MIRRAGREGGGGGGGGAVRHWPIQRAGRGGGGGGGGVLSALYLPQLESSMIFRALAHAQCMQVNLLI